MTRTSITLFILLASFTCVLSGQMDCFQKLGDSYFDIQSLENTTADYSIDLNSELYIEFNICRFASRICGDRYSFANIFNRSDPTQCVRLTNTTKFQGVYFDFINGAAPGQGIQLKLAGGEPGKQLSGVFTASRPAIASEDALPTLPAARLLEEQSTSIIMKDQQGIEINDFNLERKLEGTPHLRALHQLQKEIRMLQQTVSADGPENIDTNETNHFAFILQFDCVADQDFALNGYTYTPSNYTFKVFVNSTHGCPELSLGVVGNFIYKYRIVFMIIGLVIGLIETFLGLIFYYPSIFFAGFNTGFFPSLICFFSLAITPESATGVKVMLFIFAVLLGCTSGLITASYRRLGHFIIGAWFGIIIFMILYLAVLYKIRTNPANLLPIIGISVFGTFFGLGALKFYEVLIIISTSLCGAYMTIRALSLVTGHFPNEFELAEQIKLGNLAFIVQWQFYIYMNAIIVLAILGTVLQIKLKKRRDRKAKEAETYFAIDDKGNKGDKSPKAPNTSNWNKAKKFYIIGNKGNKDKSQDNIKEKSENTGKKMNKAQELIERLKQRDQKKKGKEFDLEP